MSEAKIDWTKPIQTRDGKAARLLGTVIGESARCKAVAAMDAAGHESVYVVTETGDFYIHEPLSLSVYDIVNVPPPKQTGVLFLNVYTDAPSCVHRSRELANAQAAPWRRACVEVYWTEGEGL